MISGPRNISTAMLYSFDNRPDCIGVDEPFYAEYLTRFPHINHPGKASVLETMPSDHQAVIDHIYSQVHQSPYLFIKNMSHHMDGTYLSWMIGQKVFMLIRDPRKVITSFTKVISQPTASDIGIIQQWKIYQALTDMGHSIPIVNTDKFLQSPGQQLKLLCTALQIPYSDSMLKWNPGPRRIDGVWAPYWYQSVHKSRGFNKTAYVEPPELEAKYLPIYEEVLPSYLNLEKCTL